jgi:hypothetical protein
MNDKINHIIMYIESYGVDIIRKGIEKFKDVSSTSFFKANGYTIAKNPIRIYKVIKRYGRNKDHKALVMSEKILRIQ